MHFRVGTGRHLTRGCLTRHIDANCEQRSTEINQTRAQPVNMPSPKFKLLFPVADIEKWAASYAQNSKMEEECRVQTAARIAKKRGYMTRGDFLKVTRWKSPRPKKWYEANSNGKIKSATRTAFASTDARVKIERLIKLSGVNYPVASAILHLVCEDVPIVDVNALAAFGLERRTNYNFQFWNAYCDAVRAIVKKSGLSYRIVDRALWSYGKVLRDRRHRR